MREFVRVTYTQKEIKSEKSKIPIVSVYPTYQLSGEDYMKKGGKFYAILNHQTGMWSTDESDVYKFIDNKTRTYITTRFQKNQDGQFVDEQGFQVFGEFLNDSSSNRLIEFNRWFNNAPANLNYIPLDAELTFKDDLVTPQMYRSKRLPYNIAEGSIEAYETLMTTLYSSDDLQKIEWAVGSVLSGDSKTIEKIVVLYGDPGSGKSTVLDLIKKMFEGYWCVFSADELVSRSNQFATAAFKDNPLLAIQDDGSLSKIEHPRINEIISHKDVIINEKSKQQYTIRSNAMLFLATNETVDIRDTKFGITRRLLDVYPTGNKLPVTEYRALVKRMDFEISAIAYHCLQVYKELGKEYYEGYIPEKMIQKTNYLRNFFFDKMDAIAADEYCYRDNLYTMYKNYCEESGLGYPPKRIIFGEQIKEYFDNFYPIKWIGDHSVRNVYHGLKIDKIMGITRSFRILKDLEPESWIELDANASLLDKSYFEYPAQYATEDGSPKYKWENVKTKLKDIDTHKLHWFKLPPNVIKIDFDLRDEEGNKSLAENLREASKFPMTYAEVSKSGQGIHLYYIYDGDVDSLSRLYAENIEIKVSTGNNSHRRVLTMCNTLPIATISTGLPLKGGTGKMIDENVAQTEKGLRTTIKKCLAKEIHPDTRSNVDFIYKILKEAYESGIIFDVSDMRQDIFIFACNSTHQSDYCIGKVGEMKFKSEEGGNYDNSYDMETPMIFFDYEVFPNLVLLCWKYAGEDQPVMKMFNPTPQQISEFCGVNKPKKPRIVGFNNKEYDNHISYAIMMGKSTYEVYMISQAIINKDKGAKFREAYNLSYTDILDFLSKKQSLKKWEIQLGIHHQELGLSWDQPVDESLWPLVAEYCANDVVATEAVFNANQPDWKGRMILVDLANIIMGPGSTVNDSTNTLTTKLIVGNEKNPQSEFVYPDLSKEFPGYEFNKFGIDKSRYISEDVIISGKSIYRGYDPGEGGFVYAVPGMYSKAETDDSASHHPSSLIAENGFGRFTPNFKRLLDLRLHIKHKEYDIVRKMYNGALAKYLESDEDAKALSYALKIAINSVYGLTAASFPHPLHDPRNVDNWVAKRGALFMIDLMLGVRDLGYTVIHCKTDSIKVLNPDDTVRNYIYSMGKQYGYTFEIENKFDRICLVNDAVYICKMSDDPENGDEAGKWHATGKQFQVPYVFKTLFSHEPIEFSDLCETKNVSTALYLDMNEKLPEGEHDYRFVGKTGQFCPIKSGCGGGILYREKDGKYYAAESTTGYRWLESEVVKSLGKEDDIDRSFYNVMVDKAVETISKFGSFEEFTAEVYNPPKEELDSSFVNVPEGIDEELPWEE